MKSNPLQTERTLLRRFNLSDLENLKQLESDPDVMCFTPSRLPQSVEVTKQRLRSLLENEKVHDPLGVWAVEIKGTKEFVGWFMLMMTHFDVPEIGFMVVKSQWGKGLATEVVRALIKYAFTDLKHTSIAAVTDHNNMTSQHILKKLGFEKIDSKMKVDHVLKTESEIYIYSLTQVSV